MHLPKKVILGAVFIVPCLVVVPRTEGKVEHRIIAIDPEPVEENYSDGVEYGGGGGGPPQNITIHINIDHIIFDCNDPCQPDNAKVIVRLLDCDGEKIGDKEQIIPFPVGDCLEENGWQITDRELDLTFDFDLNECQFPSKYEVYGVDNSGGWPYEGECFPAYKKANRLAVIDIETLPPLLDYPASEEDFDCYACSDFDPIPSDFLQYYKSTETLYTLSTGDLGQADGLAMWGEAVNGEFKAPQTDDEAVLFVTVKLSNDALSSEVDLYGSSTPNGNGWQVPSGRQGALITEKSLTMTTDDRFQFNVRGGMSDDPPDMEVTFLWHDRADWDREACCFKMRRRVLNIKVEPLPCRKVGGDPVDPSLALVDKMAPISGPQPDPEVELMLPKCCLDDGNRSAGFIAWPTVRGDRVRIGHAKGWQVHPGSPVVLEGLGPKAKKHSFNP